MNTPWRYAQTADLNQPVKRKTQEDPGKAGSLPVPPYEPDSWIVPSAPTPTPAATLRRKT